MTSEPAADPSAPHGASPQPRRSEADVESVVRAAAEALHDLAHRLADDGRSLADIGTPAQIAARMIKALPQPSPWNSAIGPFHTSAGAAALLGDISRQALADRRARRSILALRTRDGHWVYPARQFDADGRIVEGLAPILRSFDPEIVDNWTVAGWLAASMPVLDGMSPLEWLHAAKDPQVVHALAVAAANRWAA